MAVEEGRIKGSRPSREYVNTDNLIMWMCKFLTQSGCFQNYITSEGKLEKAASL